MCGLFPQQHRGVLILSWIFLCSPAWWVTMGLAGSPKWAFGAGCHLPTAVWGHCQVPVPRAGMKALVPSLGWWVGSGEPCLAPGSVLGATSSKAIRPIPLTHVLPSFRP